MKITQLKGIEAELYRIFFPFLLINYKQRINVKKHIYQGGKEVPEKNLLATQKAGESFICHTVSDNWPSIFV